MKGFLIAESAVQGVSAVKLNVPGRKQSEVLAKFEPAGTKADTNLGGAPQKFAYLPAEELLFSGDDGPE